MGSLSLMVLDAVTPATPLPTITTCIAILPSCIITCQKRICQCAWFGAIWNSVLIFSARAYHSSTRLPINSENRRTFSFYFKGALYFLSKLLTLCVQRDELNVLGRLYAYAKFDGSRKLFLLKDSSLRDFWGCSKKA